MLMRVVSKCYLDTHTSTNSALTYSLTRTDACILPDVMAITVALYISPKFRCMIFRFDWTTSWYFIFVIDTARRIAAAFFLRSKILGDNTQQKKNKWERVGLSFKVNRPILYRWYINTRLWVCVCDPWLWVCVCAWREHLSHEFSFSIGWNCALNLWESDWLVTFLRQSKGISFLFCLPLACLWNGHIYGRVRYLFRWFTAKPNTLQSTYW